jgi:hypothetical protein
MSDEANPVDKSQVETYTTAEVSQTPGRMALEFSGFKESKMQPRLTDTTMNHSQPNRIK